MAHATRLIRQVRQLAAADAGDAALLARYFAGRDEQAFTTLVGRHAGLVVGVCRRILHDPAAADDVAQATFLLLARRAGRIRRPEAVAGWLHETARNLALSHRRDEARRRQREAVAARPEATADPLDEITVREYLRIFDEEVGRLPEAHRLPLLLCGLEGCTIAEAAHRLGWTAGAVKGRLERGRVALHAQLERRGLGQVPLAAVGVPAGFVARATGPATPAVLAIADAGLRGMTLVKAKLGLAAAVLVLAAGLLASAIGGNSQPPAAQPEAKPKLDRHGDPLPADALLRLGTLRHRELRAWDCWDRLLADGKTHLVGRDGTVYDLDPDTGKRRGVWALPGEFRAVGFSPDGRAALIHDTKRDLGLYDFRAGEWLRRFDAGGRLGFRIECAFSADGRLAATVDYQSQVPARLRVWDAGTGKRLWQRGDLAKPERLALIGFLPGGKGLAVLREWDYQVHVLDATGGRELTSFATGSANELRSYHLSPDGTTVAIGTTGKTARFWDVKTGKELPPLGGHEKQAHRVAFSPDNSRVLTGGADSFVLVHAWPGGERVARVELPAGKAVETFALSRDNRLLRVRLWGDTATSVYEVRTGRDVTPYPGAHAGRVTGVSVTRDGHVISAGQDDSVRVWDARTGDPIRRVRVGHRVGVHSMAASPDGKLIATGEVNEGVVRLFDRDTGAPVRTITTAGLQINGLGFGGPTRLLIQGKEAAAGTGSGGPFLVLHDARTGALLRRLPPSPFGLATISRDGTRVLGHDPDGLWLGEPGVSGLLRGLPEDVGMGCIAPDGRTLALSVRESGVHVWEVATRQVRCRLDKQPRYLCFSRDGRWLAVAGGSTIELWDPLRGRRLHTFHGHDDSVTALGFSPDGRRLVSGSDDTTLLVWDVAGVLRRTNPPPADLAEKALTAAWEELGHTDAGAAAKAMADLLARPRQATALLRQRLRPAAALAPGRVNRLLVQLDADTSAGRAAAERELAGLGPDAEPALREFLEGKPSAAARRSAERLYRRVEHGGVADADHLRQLRAVEVLERIGDNHAIDALRILAGGALDAWLTRQAAAAIERLR